MRQLTIGLEHHASAEALIQRGQLRSATAEYDLAIADLDRVLRQTPNHGLALSLRALVNETRGAYDEAIRDLTPFLELKSADGRMAGLVAARIYLVCGKPADAIAVLNRVFDGGDDTWSRHVLRGKAHRAGGDFVSADADFDAADRLLPSARDYVAGCRADENVLVGAGLEP